jgi:hypothetical protein
MRSGRPFALRSMVLHSASLARDLINLRAQLLSVITYLFKYESFLARILERNDVQDMLLTSRYMGSSYMSFMLMLYKAQ